MKYLYLLSAIAIVAICSCNNPRYISSPSVANAAFFRQQGDFKFSASASGNPFSVLNDEDDDDDANNYHGFDVQGAVALSNHFLIQAGGMYRSETDRFDTDDLLSENTRSKVGYTRSMFDVGAGFYVPMSASGRVYLNGVVGVGFGKSSSTDRGYPTARTIEWKADVIKYYLQPSFNMFFNDYVRMSVVPRVSILDHQNIESGYTEEQEIRLGYDKVRRKNLTLFEPSILLQTGFRNNRWLKLDFGLHFSSDPLKVRASNYNAAPIVTDVDKLNARNFAASIGLSFYPGSR
ncbi:MAG: hypothetical protein QM727_04640 [Niabella sp.]